MSIPLLQCKNISKSYGPNVVLEPLNFIVQPGESVCLVGPSGCGKTTLLRCIAGLESLTGGTILLNGIDITGYRAEKRPIVLMFQQPLLFPHMTVLENVVYGLKSIKMDKTQRTQLGKELLEKIEMTGYENRYPFELSGGQQQRVSLARTLAVKPQLLLLDEPFSCLDPELRGTIRNWVRNLLRTEGITSIFVTHDKEEAMMMGDRVAVMMDHSVQQLGNPLEVYFKPQNSKVADFFSEGILLGDGSFVHISKIQITRKQNNHEPEGVTLDGLVTSKWVKSGQLVYHVLLSKLDTEITIPSAEEYWVNDSVNLSFNKLDKIFFNHGG